MWNHPKPSQNINSLNLLHPSKRRKRKRANMRKKKQRKRRTEKRTRKKRKATIVNRPADKYLTRYRIIHHNWESHKPLKI